MFKYSILLHVTNIKQPKRIQTHHMIGAFLKTEYPTPSNLDILNTADCAITNAPSLSPPSPSCSFYLPFLPLQLSSDRSDTETEKHLHAISARRCDRRAAACVPCPFALHRHAKDGGAPFTCRPTCAVISPHSDRGARQISGATCECASVELSAALPRLLSIVTFNALKDIN